jgi:hypothetical protein
MDAILRMKVVAILTLYAISCPFSDDSDADVILAFFESLAGQQPCQKERFPAQKR